LVFFKLENPEHVIQLLTEARALLSRYKQSTQTLRPILIADAHELDRLAERMRNPILERAYRSQVKPNTYRSTQSGIAQNIQNIQNLDPHSMFDLLDTWLQLRSQQSELVRDQVNGLFLNSGSETNILGNDNIGKIRKDRLDRGRVLWNVGSHKTARLSERFPMSNTGLPQFLLIMLPGALSIFYGDEIAQREPLDPRTGQVGYIKFLASLKSKSAKTI